MRLKRSSLSMGIFLILLLTSFSLAAWAQQGNGVIKGKVLNKTGQERAVSKQKVTLRKFVNQSPKEELSAEADEAGNFEFKNLTTGTNETYFVLLNYQGAEYFSNPLAFKEGEKEKTADIAVYDPTGSSQEVKLKLHHIVVDLPESGHLHVREILLFENSGNKTFVGSKEAEQGKKETLRFSLPRGVSELQHEQGIFTPYIVGTPDGFLDTMPVIPGQRQVVYSYRLKADSSRYVFKRPLDYQTPEFSLLVVNKGIKIESPLLTSQGTTQGAKNQEYLHFAGKNLKPGKTLSIELSNLPTGRGIWQWIVVGVLVFFILFGVSYPLVKRRLIRTAGAVEPSPQSANPSQTLEEQSSLPTTNPPREQLKPEPVRPEEERKKLLLEIAALDDQFETGGISEEDYKKERAEKKRRLIEFTNELKKTKEV